MKKYNSIQKKIVYLNIVFLLVFIIGSTLSLIGMFLDNITTIHTVILESVAVPCITGTIYAWTMELKKFLIIRKMQEEVKDVKKD